MKINRWLLGALLLVAACVGAGGIIATISIYHDSDSSDAFCTQCHVMVLQADDPYFKRSRHRSNNVGVRPSCGNCHVPAGNWFISTFNRVKFGLKDTFSDLEHDFRNPTSWAAYRVDLEPKAQAVFRAQDSITCRSCHNANAINPTSEAGRSSHAALRQGGTTCIDCHTNLVHPPAAPVGAQPLGGPAPSR